MSRRSDLKRELEDIITAHLELTDEFKDGTYLYWLTRVKGGNVTLDDFVEINSELADNIVNSIMKLLDKKYKYLLSDWL